MLTWEVEQAIYAKPFGVHIDIPDGTYDIENKCIYSPNCGYAVAIYSSEDGLDVLIKVRQENDILNKAYLGKYGNLWEVTLIFKDFETAKIMAKLFDQYSIWDFENNREVII